MGGRALKKVETRRISRADFDRISTKLVEILKSTFKRVEIPRFYDNKESFGDIDIIVSMDGFKGNINNYIVDNFKPNEIFHNGNSWSFDYEQVQVDIITCADEDFDSNYHYLAFNDLGNYIGRMAQSIGFKYGQEGLWYNHYSDENHKTKIIVSKDYRDIFNFLDLDYDVWLKGFNTLEEIFEFTMTSKYFNPKIFELSQLNKINRERNKKRASYMSFLDYIKDKESHPEYNRDEIELIKSSIIYIIRDGFPEANIDLRLSEIAYYVARRKYVNTKFNGNLLKEKFGLEGKELGDSIKKFKDYIKNINGDYFDEYIINTPQDNIFIIFKLVNEIK